MNIMEKLKEEFLSVLSDKFDDEVYSREEELELEMEEGYRDCYSNDLGLFTENLMNDWFYAPLFDSEYEFRIEDIWNRYMTISVVMQ